MSKRCIAGGAAVLLALVLGSGLWAQTYREVTRWPVDRHDQERTGENSAVGMNYPQPSEMGLVWFHPTLAMDDPHRWYALETDAFSRDYLAAIYSSPVVGYNEAPYTGTNTAPYAVYVTENEWDITYQATDPPVPDPYATYAVGAVYAYGLEGSAGTGSGGDLLWRHQLGSEFGTDDYGAPYSVPADAPATVARVDLGDGNGEKDYLFVASGRYATIEWARDEDDMKDDTADIYTGFIYCIDPEDIDTSTTGALNESAIKWIFPLRYRADGDDDLGIEWHHTGAGFAAPVVWVNPQYHDQYIIYQACVDGTILKLDFTKALQFIDDPVGQNLPDKLLKTYEHEVESFRVNVKDATDGVFGYVNMAPALVNGDLYFGTSIGVFYRVNSSGAVVARYPSTDDDPPVVGAILSSPAYVNKNSVDIFVFTSYNGNVYCVTPAGGSFQELWVFDPTTNVDPRPDDTATTDYLWNDRSRFDAGPALAEVRYEGYDVLTAYVVSANGVLRGICAQGIPGEPDITAGNQIFYPVYVGGAVYAPPIITFVDLADGGVDDDFKVVWVCTQAGDMRAYQANALDPNGNDSTIDDIGDVRWAYRIYDPQIIGGPCGVWDPDMQHGWVIVPGSEGYLWAFGNANALFSDEFLPEGGEGQGELVDAPEAVQPKVDYDPSMPADHVFEWGDTLKLVATDLDTTEAKLYDGYGNVIATRPSSPTVTFEISSEGISTQKVTVQMERDTTSGLLKDTVSAEILLDPTPAANKRNQKASQKIWLVPGARYTIKITSKSVTETAWRWFVTQDEYRANGSPDPEDGCPLLPSGSSWSDYAVSRRIQEWREGRLDLNDNDIVLVSNVNEPGTFTVNNPLMLRDLMGRSDVCNPVALNGSINEGLTVLLDRRDPNDVTRVIEYAGHGQHTQLSEWSRLWIADRSNMYKLDKDISQLRMSVDGGYLYRFGGIDGVVNPLLGPPYSLIRDEEPAGIEQNRDERLWQDIHSRAPSQGGISSPDYPDIDADSVQIETPWGDPTQGDVVLPRRAGVPGDNSTMVRELELPVRVNVPRFQPAAQLLVSQRANRIVRTGGYQAVVTVWVDLDSDNTPDIPGPIDRTYQQEDQQQQQQQQVLTPSIGRYEPYRQFVIAFGVGVDKNMGFGTGTVDLGAIPQGTLSYLGPAPVDPAPDGTFFCRQTLQVQNRGNVNLMDVRLLNRHFGDPSYDAYDYWLWGSMGVHVGPNERLTDSLYSDPVDWRVPLSAEYILCTLNGEDNRADPADPHYDSLFEGPFTLHKARVAGMKPRSPKEPSGVETFLRIPDTEDTDRGELPMITVQVPPKTPLGLYRNRLYTMETGMLDYLGADPGNHVDIGYQVSSYFTLAATVTERRLTEEPDPALTDLVDPDMKWTTWDGRFQLDDQGVPLLSLDSGPCILREWSGGLWGSMRLWFATNYTSLMSGQTPQASDPSRMVTARLDYQYDYDSTDHLWRWYKPLWGETWWTNPIEFPDPALSYFTDEFGPNPHEDYFAPSATMNQADGVIWLAWLGTSFKAEGTEGGQHSQSLTKLFFAPAKPPTDSEAGTPDTANQYILPDTTPDKRSPKPLVYREAPPGDPQVLDWYWLFWDAGLAGNSQIYLTNQINTPGKFSTSPSAWSGIQRLPLPSGMMGARDASPIKRTVLFEPMMDVVYSASVRGRPAPDLYLSRYRVVAEPRDQALPTSSLQLVTLGVFGETAVERIVQDATTYYVTEGVDWDVDARIAGERAYPLVGLTSKALGHIRLTRSTNGVFGARWDYRDPRTGITVYDYGISDNTGLRVPYKTTIDPGAGTIRIESADPNNFPLPVASDVVQARYVPRALRVTMDDAADTGPTAFIDKLGPLDPETGRAEPFAGYPTRLWVVWRKTQAGLGKGSGEINYKTYRLGVELPVITQAADPPDAGMGLEQQIAVERVAYGTWDDDHFIPLDFSVSALQPPAVGPYFVDAVNRRVYFTEQDEGRTDLVIYYRTVDRDGTISALGTYNTSSGPPSWMSERVGLPFQDPVDFPFRDVFPFDNGTRVPLHLAGNMGQVSAFVDPIRVRDWYNPKNGESNPPSWFDVPPASLVWVVYTGSGSRNNMDVYWTTLSPSFGASGGVTTERHVETYYPLRQPLRSRDGPRRR